MSSPSFPHPPLSFLLPDVPPWQNPEAPDNSPWQNLKAPDVLPWQNLKVLDIPLWQNLEALMSRPGRTRTLYLVYPQSGASQTHQVHSLRGTWRQLEAYKGFSAAAGALCLLQFSFASSAQFCHLPRALTHPMADFLCTELQTIHRTANETQNRQRFPPLDVPRRYRERCNQTLQKKRLFPTVTTAFNLLSSSHLQRLSKGALINTYATVALSIHPMHHIFLPSLILFAAQDYTGCRV